MARPLLQSGLTPWLGWISGPIAWVIHHQVIADSVYFDCHVGERGADVVVGLLCILLALAGGALSWAGRQGPADQPKPKNRRFIADMGLGMALLFTVALAFQTLAGFIIPGCAR
jgi:hypothetical protein